MYTDLFPNSYADTNPTPNHTRDLIHGFFIFQAMNSQKEINDMKKRLQSETESVPEGLREIDRIISDATADPTVDVPLVLSIDEADQ